jgi:TonB family protein
MELLITADPAGVIQKVEIAKPSKAKILDEYTRDWVEKHWKMPPSKTSALGLRKFSAPIVYPKGFRPMGGKFPDPPYPTYLMRQGVQGLIVLEIVVAQSGHIDDVKVLLSSDSKTLDEQTRSWVLKHWEFPPGSAETYYWHCEFRLR